MWGERAGWCVHRSEQFRIKTSRGGSILDAQFLVDSFQMLFHCGWFYLQNCRDLAIRFAARNPGKDVALPQSQLTMPSRPFPAASFNEFQQQKRALTRGSLLFF